MALIDNNAALANQINPLVAGGVFLDALMSLTGGYRLPATASTVLCTITGVSGTNIPSGSQISNGSQGILFQLVNDVTIPSGGTLVNIPFSSVIIGPVVANAGTLTTIVSGVLGWETVTNPDDSILGSFEQSDTSARALRQNTLGAQGTGTAQAIIAALSLTPGVTSLTFQENVSASPQTINNVYMVPHSLYVCVAGIATNLAVATTLTNVKDAGCAYNNGPGFEVSQPVVNQYSGQSINVLFDTPAFMYVSVVVTVHAFTSVQNIQSAVQNAVLQYSLGMIPNEPGFVVGGSVSPFQIAGAINYFVPGLFVQEVQVSIYTLAETATLSNSSNNITLGDTTGILMGSTVTGNGIPSSTTVSAVVSGTVLTLSNTPTINGPSLLTFTPGLHLQTTEIAVNVWQQAITTIPLITVIQV